MGFVNGIHDAPEINIIDYLYYYDGGGVAIGDVNGDGLADLYFTANQGPNKLYLNRGGLQFEDVTATAEVAGSSDWDTGVTMADVNADGHLDIYVSAVDSILGLESRNELFINNGDGTFTERAQEFGLDFRGYGTQAAFFDYDLDGDLDAFLLNHSTHEEETYGHACLREVRSPRAGDRLYRNDDGRFVEVGGSAGIYGGRVGYGLGVSISDLNLDGWPDIYVANDFHENDYLYLNDGDGTFTERIEAATGHNSRSSMGSDAADFNNDLWPDVFVLDMLPDDETILKTSASVEDRSVVAAKLQYGYHHQYPRNTLQLNRGHARFSEIGALAGVEATDWSWAALFFDADNDGWKDLFVTNGIWRRPNDLDYIETISSDLIQDRLAEITAEDLPIIELMPSVPQSNFLFRNDGDLTFTNVSSEWGLSRELFSNGAAYGDLDNDGDLDLVVNNVNAEASILENTGGGSYLGITLQGDGDNTYGIGTKVVVHADGQVQMQELVPTRGFQSSVDLRLHFGLGSATHVDSLLIIWPDRRFQTLADVPTDTFLVARQADASGQFDYARLTRTGTAMPTIFRESQLSLDFVHRENRFDDFARQPLIPHKVSEEGPALAVGDVNGDGLEDFFVGGARSQPAALFTQSSSGAFFRAGSELLRTDSLFEDVDAAFFDADQDGDLDLYVVSAGNEAHGDAPELLDRLYLNDGSGVFSRGELPDMYQNGSVVAPADFDGDGDVDLFVGGRAVSDAYGDPPRSYLLTNDRGAFVDATPDFLREIGMVTDAVWEDFDGDGRLDLAVAREWQPPVIVYAGDGDFTAVRIGSSGWWTSVEAADLDANGLPDLVLGNLGWNSRLKAGPDEPVRLYIADFDINGEVDHLLTSYRNGESYPLAGRDEFLQAFPSFAPRFPSYGSYGASQIDDIFSESVLSSARVLEAEEFATMVAMNVVDGFQLRPLPSEAQVSPVRAILADDFDEDGHIDLVLGGNFFGVMPVRGRYDASYGTYLRGNGDGTFDAPAPSVSGLWLEGEIRELKTITTAGGAELIVAARNADSLQIVEIVKREPLDRAPFEVARQERPGP